MVLFVLLLIADHLGSQLCNDPLLLLKLGIGLKLFAFNLIEESLHFDQVGDIFIQSLVVDLKLLVSLLLFEIVQ